MCTMTLLSPQSTRSSSVHPVNFVPDRGQKCWTLKQKGYPRCETLTLSDTQVRHWE